MRCTSALLKDHGGDTGPAAGAHRDISGARYAEICSREKHVLTSPTSLMLLHTLLGLNSMSICAIGGELI